MVNKRLGLPSLRPRSRPLPKLSKLAASSVNPGSGPQAGQDLDMDDGTLMEQYAK